MKSPIAFRAACVAASLGLSAIFLAGCAEEQADWQEAAYPVGTTRPSLQTARYEAPPAMNRQPEGSPAGPAVPAPVSPEVTIGAEPDEPDSQVVASEQFAAPETTVEDADPAALSDFRQTLDPYGSWVDDPSYGTVWVPSASSVGPDFSPYVTAGHWAYADDYVWVSDYSWGWAPFHYGRWAYVSGPGWEWIPGRRYAGAWVSWRYGWDDWAYVGWAPLSPTWCWRRGAVVPVGSVPAARYAFVGSGDLFAPRLGAQVVVGDRAGLVAAHTRPWVPAAAAVSGRVVARPLVGGPPPSALRIPQSAVARLEPNSGGVAQARAFARPVGPWSEFRGGLAQGGAPAAPMFGARASAGGGVIAPAYGPAAPSHFGGRMGGGFIGSPTVAAPAFTPGRAAPRAYFGPSPQQVSPQYSSPQYSVPRTAAPQYSSPQYSVPRAAPPSFHVGGASPVYSAPRVQSAPSLVSGGGAPRAAPAVRTFSVPSGGVRGAGGYSGAFQGGGGGGFRGGGGGRAGGHR